MGNPSEELREALAPRGASVIRQLKFPTRDKHRDSFPVIDRLTIDRRLHRNSVFHDCLALFSPRGGGKKADLSTLLKGRELLRGSHKEFADK